jgi:hypothetical protein
VILQNPVRAWAKKCPKQNNRKVFLKAAKIHTPEN